MLGKNRPGYALVWPLLLCTAGLFLGFANPVLHFPPMIFLFFLGLNSIALTSRTAGQTFGGSLLASGTAYSACLYWITVPVSTYGGFPMYLAVFCPMLLGFCIALFASAYALFVFTIKNSFHWVWLGVFSGCAWAALEFLREYAFTGFPWFVTAQSFAVWPGTVQAAGVVGSYGLAMIMAGAGLWISLKKIKPLFLAAVLLAISMGYGFLFPGNWSESRGIDVLAVQGNIDQTLKWERDVQLFTVEKYMDLTTQGMAGNRPDLVIWPETALPFYFQEPTELSGMVRDFVREHSLDLVVGSPAYSFHQDREGYDLFNRAFWVSPEGFVHDYYDKVRLVPFGEYVPLAGYIPFVDKLVYGEMDFSPGTARSPLIRGDLALGVLICYEIIFPGLVRQRVSQGANIIINISNDAWFGNTSAPAQHLHLSVLRAVEQNRYVVRATNTGISAFIDPRGRIYNQSELFTDAHVLDRAGLVDGKTIYFYLYWPLNLVFSLGVLSALCLHIFKKRRWIK